MTVREVEGEDHHHLQDGMGIETVIRMSLLVLVLSAERRLVAAAAM